MSRTYRSDKHDANDKRDHRRLRDVRRAPCPIRVLEARDDHRKAVR